MTVPASTLGCFILVLGLCFASRLILRSWICPPAFCAVYWAIFIAINLAFPEYPVLQEGIIYFGVVSLVFTLAHYLGARALLVSRLHPWPPQRSMRKISPALFRVGVVLQVVFGLIYIGLLRQMGVQQVEHISWLVQLLLISHFIGPLVAGLLLGGGMLRKTDRFLSFLVLAPALAISILYTGRTALIGPTVIMGTGFLAGTVVNRPRQTPLFSLPRLILITCAFAAAVLYGTGIYVLRIARGAGESLDSVNARSVIESFDTRQLQASYNSIRTSIFGQPSAFTFMLRDHYQSEKFVPYHGRFMFAGPFVLLGYERPPHASYVGPDGVDTNVYTIFAPPIEDFGVGGSLAWWAFLGLVSAVAWRAAQAGRLTGSAVIAIMLINFQIGSCFLFRYNSVIGAYVLTLAVCIWLDRHRVVQRVASPLPEPPPPSPTPESCLAH